MRDFNIGFFTSMILAVIFLAMGALIQFGSGEAVQTASAAYIRQFVTMYSNTIGSWAGGIIGLIFLVGFSVLFLWALATGRV